MWPADATRRASQCYLGPEAIGAANNTAWAKPWSDAEAYLYIYKVPIPTIVLSSLVKSVC